MSDRRFYAIALLCIALIGGGCMVGMQAAQVEIDRGFSDRLILFLGTIAAAFIFMLKADKSADEVSRKVERVEAKVDANTMLTAETKQAAESVLASNGKGP